jgi:raffinose/stachyose/melibiose transport system permease protein
MSSSTTFFPFRRRTGLHATFYGAWIPIIVFLFVPAVITVVLSFTDIRRSPGLPWQWVGIDNYLAFFNPGRLSSSLRVVQNTFVYAGLTVFVGCFLSLGIALLLNKRLAGRTIARALVFLPTILGVTVVGLIWSVIFSVYGPFQDILGWFGQSSNFFGDPNIAFYLVILVVIWSSLGTTTIIFLAGLQAIPEELYEVAAIDGASPRQVFRHITWPLLAPTFTTNMLLSVISGLQGYAMIFVLMGTGRSYTETLGMAVFSAGFGSSGASTQGFAAAVAMIQFVIVGIVSIAVLIFLRRREAKL